MTRVIHTGDTHIGYRQYHSPERRADFLDAFEAVVDDAVEMGVDAVVHAGDLFHDRRPDLQDLLGTLSALRRLDDAGVPFLAVVGNHESTRGGQWLDLFSSLGLATRLGAAPYVLGNTAFYGLDHVPRSRRDDLDYAFDPHDADYAALVSHGLFTPFAHADWETETVLRESTVDFDAVLLGDNHAPGTAVVEGTWVTYCGSTERASADEREARGYNVVEFGADADGPEDAPAGVDVRRRSLDTRPFVFVDVDLGEGEGVDRVREQVRQHDLTDAVAVVEVTGEGDPVTAAAVEDVASEEGALLARVTDRREFDPVDEAVPDVRFADPDAAVADRVREMGLSSLARDIDETVRESKAADSAVRERVRDRIEDALDDPEAFEAAETDADTDGTGDGSAEGDAAGTDGQVSMEDYL
ncbi:DNA double-strand break repair protein Mre11 [Haloplanus sp. GCM10025708]|uniref:DNA double-strand break repair protein Mre11 n=1 Tax=Haloferacaceae TaxID=1644056 RepID=UPI00360ACDD3